MAMAYSLFWGKSNGRGYPGIMILSKEQTLRLADNFRCRSLRAALSNQDRRANSGSWQMDEADELVAVENHSGSSRLATEDILNVCFKRVVLVRKGDEVITVGVGKDA